MNGKGRPYKCPRCGSTRTSWKGYRPLKNGRVRLRRCRACKRKFTTKKLFAQQAEEGAHD